jgi:uncharacterized tellurite resistance protein B-like protein
VNTNYQSGLLHFAHLLVTVDGVFDEREKKVMESICTEEEIPKAFYQEFQDSVVNKSERTIYEEGLKLLMGCSHDEKVAAIVHLFRLSEADDQIHKKEVRLLFYALGVMGVDFEDVELSGRMASSRLK